MGNNLERQMSLRKKAATAMDRLDVLDNQMEDVLKNLPQLAIGFNDALNRIQQQFSDMNETVDALVGLVGVDAVQAAIVQNRLDRMNAAAATTKANIVKALEEGKLVKVEKVTEKTLMVGRELKADGTMIPPGYSAVSFNQVKKEYREKLLGQSVGFILPTENDGKFEIIELYEGVPAAVVPAVAEATPEVAPEAVPAPPETAPVQAGTEG